MFSRKIALVRGVLFRDVLQGPGMTIAFESSRVRSPSSYEMQFNFAEDVLLNGMVISINRDNYLRAFRLRANVDKTNPILLTDVFVATQTIMPAGRVRYCSLFLRPLLLLARGLVINRSDRKVHKVSN